MSKINTDQNLLNIFSRLKNVGAAISRLNGNNTHSGNLSMRDPDNNDLFYITASGSQCGALIQRDIVPIKFSGVSWGDARGSTESTIHRQVLCLPGVNSVIHAHFLHTIFISFDSKEKQLFLHYLGSDKKGREEYLFQPVDLFGASFLGKVKVGSYYQPVGSAEMEERIPQYLRENKITIVRGHGPFACGASPEETFYYLNLLDMSAKIAFLLRRRLVHICQMQKKIITIGFNHFFPAQPHFLYDSVLSNRDISDQSILDDFKQRLNYNFNNQIGAFGTGSMSQKISVNEMIYCPTSAVPENFAFSLIRKKLIQDKDDSIDLKIHKLIYRNTHQNTCMITSSPFATVEGMAILAEKYGIKKILNKQSGIDYSFQNHPFILPIDAEAIYLNPKLGLVDLWQIDNDSPQNPILNMLHWNKGCCVVAGYGVISSSETTLEQAAHNASSAERIGQFRIETFVNEKFLSGTPVSCFEPKINKSH